MLVTSMTLFPAEWTDSWDGQLRSPQQGQLKKMSHLVFKVTIKSHFLSSKIKKKLVEHLLKLLIRLISRLHFNLPLKLRDIKKENVFFEGFFRSVSSLPSELRPP